MSNLSDAAVDYARRGWSVIPLQPKGKRPAREWTPAMAFPATVEEVEECWSERDYNVGLVTGEVSGFFVLDFDGSDLQWEELERLGLPDGPRVNTARGVHLFFQWPGFAVKNAVQVVPGADVRGDGGYVATAPSIHPDGPVYEWASDGPIPSAPAWMLPHVRAEVRPPEPEEKPPAAPRRLSRSTVDFISDGAAKGERNARLFAAACDYSGSGYSREQAGQVLGAAAVAAGLTAREAERTIQSAYDKPRTPARPPASPASSVTEDEDDRAPAQYGMAQCLAPLVVDRLCYAEHRKAWLDYDGTLWNHAGESTAALTSTQALVRYYHEQRRAGGNADVLDKLIRQACTWSNITAVLRYLQGMPAFRTVAEDWDADLDALNVENGLLDLRSFSVREHRPSDRCSRLAPVVFDESANCPKWLDHLGAFLPDQDIHRELRRHVGRSLSGYAMEERLPIWYGTGANGKTTTTRAIMGCLGTYACKAAPDLLLVTKNEQHPTSIADLAGSRVVFSVEADQSRRLHESTIKELTGGDTKKARFMRADFFEFDQTFDITLVVNHHPTIHGTDTGIWRRIRLIPWLHTLPQEERLPQADVLRTLAEERSGLLNWMLAGLSDYYDVPHWTSEEVDTATADYRQDQDILAEFLDASCTIGDGLHVGAGELYAEYFAWAERDGQKPVHKRTFGAKLRGRGFQPVKSNGVRRWAGLCLT